MHGAPTDSDACCNACWSGYEGCLELLLQHDAPVSHRACDYAVRNGHTACLRLLLEHGTGVARRAYTIAAKNGRLECLQCLAEFGVPISRAAYSQAAQRGHMECLRFFAESRAIPDTVHQSLILMWAREYDIFASDRWCYSPGCPRRSNAKCALCADHAGALETYLIRALECGDVARLVVAFT